MIQSELQLMLLATLMSASHVKKPVGKPKSHKERVVNKAKRKQAAKDKKK